MSIGHYPSSRHPSIQLQMRDEALCLEPKVDLVQSAGSACASTTYSSEAITTIRQTMSMVEQRRSSRFSRGKEHLFWTHGHSG